MVDGEWDHDEEGQEPADGNGLVSVGQCLPGSGVQWPADGEVTFQGDGDQGETARRHRHT